MAHDIKRILELWILKYTQFFTSQKSTFRTINSSLSIRLVIILKTLLYVKNTKKTKLIIVIQSLSYHEYRTNTNIIYFGLLITESTI